MQGDDSQVLQYANQLIQSAKAAASPAGGSGALGQMPQQSASMQQALVNLQNDLVNDGAVCFQNSCFAAGTHLLTPTGDKAIEQFQVGDLLLSRDERNSERPVEPKVVEEVFVRTARIMRVQVGGQDIRTTAEHPFYVRDKGWLPARELTVGDLLSSHDGQWVEIEILENTDRYETVYNLRVADYHTYFVGTRDWGFSVWAHNLCFANLPGANQALASQGQTLVLLAMQAFAMIPTGYQDGTVAVSQATIDGSLRYVFAVYGPEQAFVAVEAFAHTEMKGSVAFHATGKVHAEEYIYCHYKSNPGFPGVIGISNYNGVCPKCRTFFAGVFANIWWPVLTPNERS